MEKPSHPAPELADSPKSQATSVSDAGAATCRVCLEEDSLGNLMAPCSCTGSMMVRLSRASSSMLRRWVLCIGPVHSDMATVTCWAACIIAVDLRAGSYGGASNLIAAVAK